MTNDLDSFLHEVRRGLELKRLDPDCRAFAAATHGYRLNEPVDENRIKNVESKYGFSCPPDYRAFMRQLSDGGAGPSYGVFRFGEVDSGFGFESWETWRLDPGELFPDEHAWNGEGVDSVQPSPAETTSRARGSSTSRCAIGNGRAPMPTRPTSEASAQTAARFPSAIMGARSEPG